MSDGILSQDELNALLGGEPQEGTEEGGEIDAQSVGEILRLAMGATAEGLAIMIGEEGRVEAGELRVVRFDQLNDFLATPRVLVQNELRGEADGVVFTWFSPEAVEMLGEIAKEDSGEAEPGQLPPGFGEIVSEIALHLADALTSVLGARIDVEPGKPAQVEWHGAGEPPFPVGVDEDVVFADFRLTVGETSFTIAHIVPVDVASWMHAALEQHAAAQEGEEVAAAAEVDLTEAPSFAVREQTGLASSAPARPAASGAGIASASFAELAPERQESKMGNIDLLLDVPLQVTVELGRTRMQIREVLELGKGSIVELEKLAGEPVEVYVNGKLIAKGEVVTIDENFGVKITDIVSRGERVSNLQ